VTKFVALGGVTDTDTDTHVFVAVAGALKPMSVNGKPSTVVAPMAVTFNVKVPAPASSTVNWHVPPIPVPGVRHDDAGSSVPGPVVDAVNVVPSGTAVQSGSAGVAAPVCCTVTVNVCGTPVGFAAFGLSSPRYCSHVIDAVTGTTGPGA
jgi:hypothetical protein